MATSVAAALTRASSPPFIAPCNPERRPEMSARNLYEVEMIDGGAFDPSAPLQFPRRDFLKLFGSGLLIGLAPASALTQESGARFRQHQLPQDISAWIHIAPDSR